MRETLERPFRVVIFCSLFLFLNLILNGSLYRLYELNESKKSIASQIKSEQELYLSIQSKIKILQNPEFIERQARDQLELLEKNDLLFVFSEENQK